MVAALMLLVGLISSADAQDRPAPRPMPALKNEAKSYPELLALWQSEENASSSNTVTPASFEKPVPLQAPPASAHGGWTARNKSGSEQSPVSTGEIAHAEPLFSETPIETPTTSARHDSVEPVVAAPAVELTPIPSSPPMVQTASLPNIPSQPPMVSETIVPAGWTSPAAEAPSPLTLSTPPHLTPVAQSPAPRMASDSHASRQATFSPGPDQWIFPQSSWVNSASAEAPVAESFSSSHPETFSPIVSDQLPCNEMSCESIGCDGMSCPAEGCNPCNNMGYYQGDPLCPLPNPQGRFLPFGVLGVIPGNHRTIGMADIFLPFAQSEDSLLFGDFRGDWDNQGAGGGAGYFGLGYRTFLDQSWIFGGYVYGDLLASRSGNYFGQANLGVEMLSLNWDFRLNGYLPGSGPDAAPYANGYSDGTLITQNFRERAYGGVDFEVGKRLLYWGWNDHCEVRGFVGGYSFQTSATGFPDWGGVRGRLELRIYDICGLGNQSRLEFGVEQAYDHVRNGQFYGFARIRIPFGGRCRDLLDPLRRRMVDMPVRPLN
jgi:hypothetical protein